jgi:hypothetical protein
LYFCTLTKKHYSPMIKKIALIATISCFLLAGISALAQEKEVTVLTPTEFPDKAESLLGQKVQIDGLVVHVCKHGGKKMFIVGDNPDIRVKIDASEEVTVFGAELEGSTVSVQGIIQPMAEEEVPESEKQNQDAEHTNYYHQKQFSISCTSVKVVE